MEKNNFFNKINQLAEKIEINLDENKQEKFYNYMNLLLEWNEKINLTAITEPDDIILKHFIDSMTIIKYIEKNKKVIDVGTGAGFPGIPCKIIREDMNIVLLDSLNKRINVLKEIIEKINLKEIEAVHARVEEFGKNKENREKYDIAVSRAVANLSVLAEYMIPLIKVGGKCICMKGPDAEEEIKKAKKAIEILGGKIEKIDEFELPESDIKRTIIIISKIKNTPLKFPRKSGTAAKEPLE